MDLARPMLPTDAPNLQTGGPAAYIAEQRAAMVAWTRDEAAKRGASRWHPAALHQAGWFRSRAGGIVDGECEALPWYCYAATQHLASIAKPWWRVIEYGLGSSTLWWAARVAHITAIEHDPVWVEKFEHRLPPNVSLEFIDQLDPRYKDRLLEEPENYDLISVDGKRRNSVVKRAAAASKLGGFLLFDDSQKVRYAKPLKKLRNRGFEQSDFWGPKPLQAYSGKTSLFERTQDSD